MGQRKAECFSDFETAGCRSFSLHDLDSLKNPSDFESRLFRKLQLLDDAMSDADFGVPPRNHFEKLRGSLAEWHSIRINDQRRLIFQWNA
jgi:proteic killer suppression protein